MFGENLTTEGLDETSVHIGDQFRIGSAVLQVTQPRTPCYKLGIKFGRSDMVEKFWSSRRSGFYFSVVVEGELGSGDSIERVFTGLGAVCIAKCWKWPAVWNPTAPARTRSSVRTAG